jgi:toxin ParE1/3/4
VANRLKRLPLAERDLDDIWLNIALDNPSAADRVIDRLTNAEWLLCERPLAGRARPELLAGLRSWPVGAYLILYLVEPGQTVIVRVVWGGRNLPDLFRSDPA